MSLRWRITGELLCGAKTAPKEYDTYIDDRLHYQLSRIGSIEPDETEAETGLWWWREHTPYWDELNEKN